ncbi:helix-turn-helix domain-containing protein [Streptomyces sp. NPDC001414]
MEKTLREAIAVCIRLNRAQDAYGVTADNKEVGLKELIAAGDAFRAFIDGLRGEVDMDLAQAAAMEVTTGRKHPYIQRDEEGNPVALVPPRGMTDEQVAQARELLADPKQTITAVAKALGVTRAVLYSEVPEANGRYARLRATAQQEGAVAP